MNLIARFNELLERLEEIRRELNNVVKASAYEQIDADNVNELLERLSEEVINVGKANAEKQIDANEAKELLEKLYEITREVENVVKASADQLIDINGDKILGRCDEIMRKVNHEFKLVDYEKYKGKSSSIYEKYKGKIEEYVKSPKSVLEKPNPHPPQVGKFRENKTDENKIESIVEKSEEISPKISLSARKIGKIVKLRQKLMKRRKNWSLTMPAVAIGAVALILFLV